jgi:3-hydroxybutyryl-CoA dehydrogenase
MVYDVEQPIVDEALVAIQRSIEQGVQRGKTTAEAAAQAGQALRPTLSLVEAATADLVIEAAPEQLELKRQIFTKLDAAARPETIFASNTSSLSVNVLGAASGRPDRFLGLHFFNPAHIMRLVEVIGGDDTSEETMARATTFVQRIGKEPVFCQDTPAFIVNRVARPFYGEAFRLLGEGAASVADIDRLLKSVGFRMGPFELIDLIGCDVNFAVTQQVYEAYFHEPRYRPHPIQRRMVDSGRLGRKSGRGFYKYEGS